MLVCEVNAQERIAPLLGAPPVGRRRSERSLPGLFTVNVTPHEAMREYGVMVLRFRTIYDAVFENRLVRYFLRVVPSLAELVMLGKILHEARAEERGPPALGPRGAWTRRPPATPCSSCACPSALLDTVPGGPLRHDAEWMQALLVDPRAHLRSPS